MDRKCIKCKGIYPNSAFNKRSVSKDGLDNRCRICVNNRRRSIVTIEQRQKNLKQSQHDKNIRRVYVNKIKEKGCSICGYNKCKLALTFHHIDRATKIKSIADMVTRRASIEDIQKEIDKCILLCQNCHHELHDKIGDFGIDNGKLL